MIKKIPRVLAGSSIALAVAGCGLAGAPQPATPDLAQVAQEVGGPALADPAPGSGPLQLEGNPLTVYVQVTDAGFQPSVVSIPQGMLVRMVLVNRDKSEHHFHVLGLRAAAAMWLVKDGLGPDLQNQIASGEIGDTLAGHGGAPVSYVDQHPCKHFCVDGICYTKNTLHAYAAPDDFDEVVFTAVDKGEFTAGDPLNPALQATVRVF